VSPAPDFLGSHLIDRILTDGHEVLCVDNLFTDKAQHRASEGSAA
jgi:UDP-glucuronate decarboxylase